jgi:hypothetical protein
MERYECYHGTSQEAGLKIMKEKHFDLSCRDDEWAGTGIYYFIDLSESEEPVAYKNAKYWAKFKKHYKPQVILKSSICIDETNLLDLHTEYYQMQFHRFRTSLFREALIRARKQGVNLKEKYLCSGKLDCETINEMCQHGKFEAVIKQVYIACLSYPNAALDDYPNSSVPNCTIFCLRNEHLINNTVRA